MCCFTTAVMMLRMSDDMKKCMKWIPGPDVACVGHEMVEDIQTWTVLTQSISLIIFALSACFMVDT